MGPCNRGKGRICAEKRKGIPIIKGGKRGGKRVYKETVEEGIHLLSKSPQTALVFFVGKKDGKERMVQDYRYLNEWTIKNNYPLPLISDVLENIGTKKVLTKMDLR